MRINNKRTKTPENELKEMEISNKILSGLEYNIEEFTTERTGLQRIFIRIDKINFVNNK